MSWLPRHLSEACPDDHHPSPPCCSHYTVLSSSKDSRMKKGSSRKSNLHLPQADRPFCESPHLQGASCVQSQHSQGHLQAGHSTGKREAELVRSPIFNKSTVPGEITQLYLDMHNTRAILLGPPSCTHSQGQNYLPITVAERCS